MAASGNPSTPNRKNAAAPARRTEAAGAVDLDPAQLEAIRQVFWHNVVREMLSGLTAVAEKRPELMDGRFAVLTHGGERIPIARVEPVFAYTVRGTSAERRASAAVQLTVFRVSTPDGEVFTLPVQEVRGFHELTPELLARIQQIEDEQSKAAGEEEPRPFGFAAFQALPKPAPSIMMPVPSDPQE